MDIIWFIEGPNQFNPVWVNWKYPKQTVMESSTPLGSDGWPTPFHEGT